jgi:hypothetical protein
MLSEDKRIIIRVVERYVRTGNIEDEQVKVTCLSENKTSAIERVGDDSRSIMLDEYKVDGTSIWAGYSGKSGMVFISPVRHY